MNIERTGNAGAAIGGTVPWMERVILGRVRINGRVVTDATCTGGCDELVGSIIETSKGSDGPEKSRFDGAGLIAVAVP